MLSWILPLFALLITLVIAVVVIGYLLPQSHRATRRATFHHPPETLYARITGPQDWRNVTKTDLPPENNTPRWTEKSRHGTITFEQAAAQPPLLFQCRIADKNLPFAGTWTFQLTPNTNSTTLQITEDGIVHNPLFRFISRFLIGHTKSLDTYLTSLATHLHDQISIE